MDGRESNCLLRERSVWVLVLLHQLCLLTSVYHRAQLQRLILVGLCSVGPGGTGQSCGTASSPPALVNGVSLKICHLKDLPLPETDNNIKYT